jgi:hypothetical protein
VIGSAGPLGGGSTSSLPIRRLGRGSVRDEQQTKAAIETFERRWGQLGFGMFALELRATGELRGFTGLAVP